ncbi:hypothetical protein M011DRAFT_528797 [Sporormia fimetaria CBS 119925]|uniref:Family A G protein-coupled receptor-like protein n=1 Tax=Sporormia fimetaria CBS 119925 TaxID=1340428 RepID=A0A6A6V070_9PLEO|nr:hypothetical protein M011DRAFT_528797 [Sporormia fimetaria CBS 119925]
MAPKGGGRGGGYGGGGGEGGSTCPGAFREDSLASTGPLFYFISYCVFFVVTVGIIYGFFRTRKRHGHAKHLLGPVFGLTIFCLLIAYALIITGTVLVECSVQSWREYPNWGIAWAIFYRLGEFLLLVLAFHNANATLRQGLNSSQTRLKILSACVLGIMGCLSIAVLAVTAYNSWTETYAGLGHDDVDSDTYLHLYFAYYFLYLLAAVVGSSISVASIFSLRSRRICPAKLRGWTIALAVSMTLWPLLTVAQYGSYIDPNGRWNINVSYAWAILVPFFQSLAFIAMLLIAKAASFDTTEQFTFNGAPDLHKNPATTVTPQYYQQPVQQSYPPPGQQHYPPPGAQPYYGAPATQQYYEAPGQPNHMGVRA